MNRTLSTTAPRSAVRGRPETSFELAQVVQNQPEQVLSFGHYGWLLRRQWWKIAIVVALCTGFTGLVAFRLTPMYDATARVAIDRKTPSTVMGESAVYGGASDVDQMFNTELQLMQSDAVLRPVAEQFHLVTPERVRKMPGGMKASDSAVNLANLSVVHPVNSYLININYRSADPVQSAAVANAVAHSYITRTMAMRVHSSLEDSAFMEKQLVELKQNMDDSAIALAGYEKQLGIINADEKTSILTARLLQLNTEFTEAQNDRIHKQADYLAFKSGSTAAIEVSPQASALAKMEESVHAAQEKMAAAKTIYGPNYSEYKRAANELNEVTRQYAAMQVAIGERIEVEFKKASNREGMLHQSLMQSKSEADALNAHSLEYQELKRQAEANKTLYTELYRKVKEAGINGAFQGSAIRIADEARPQISPSFPNKSIFLGLGFMLSLMGSVVVVIISDLVNKTVRDPEQVRRATGMEVMGVLPRVRNSVIVKAASSLDSRDSMRAMVKTESFAPADFYQESIQTLLSTILIGHRGSPLRTVLITSASAGEGKTSCIAHLAAAYARQGHRALLIDADLRRPALQNYFDLRDGPGLADAIHDGKTLSEIRQQVPGVATLDIVTAGNADVRAYNQIGRKVEELLVEARREYDMVFIDAPPMLCFTEPIQLACIADGVLVVGHASHTNVDQIMGVLATLSRLRARTLGIVLNQVQNDMSAAYKQYQSYYRTDRRPALKSA